MSWMAKLFDTYERALELDLPDDQRLLPIAHTLQNAHINIVVDGDGHFRRASVLEKPQIILPATESSASRGNGEAPHALADKLQYIAGDYLKHGGTKRPYFESYQKQLKKWCVSQFSHPHAEAILNYISKREVLKDLVEYRVVHVNADNILIKHWANREDPPPLLRVLPKQTGGFFEQGDALVCWTVEYGAEPNADTWKNQSLQTSWTKYYKSLGGTVGLCYVDGTDQIIGTNHPAKLRHTGDRAKLISANDLSGYTFRGKFTDSKKSIDETGHQSAVVSFEISQKAHNALQWLIKRQGFRNGDHVVLAWAVSGQTLPSLMQDTHSIISNFDIPDHPTIIAEKGHDDQLDHTRNAGHSFSNALAKAMAGYRAALEPTEDIIIMALDSATPGRLAITYYRESFAYEFLKLITRWHEEFAWYQRFPREVAVGTGKTKNIVAWSLSAPAPKTIIEAVYGKLVTDSLRKNLIQRLLPCIAEARPIPKDIVRTSINRAANRSGMEYWEWERCLGVTCSLYKGYYRRHPNEHKRRNYLMALEETNNSRDYLYGRLLALAEHVESFALNLANENRPTNAERLMQRFSQRPSDTWQVITVQLSPYLERIRRHYPPLADAFKDLLSEITNMFETKQFNSKAPLSGEYLLGFHCQRVWIKEHQYREGKWVSKDLDKDQATGEDQ